MKKYLIELLGTFFLVLTISLSKGNPVAIGAVLTAMVYVGGKISGAHFNPAVTLSNLFQKSLKLKDILIYILVQIAGAALGSLVFFVLTGDSFYIAQVNGTSMIAAMFAELIFTFLLCTVILNVTAREDIKENEYFGLAIGFTLLACIAATASVSGGIINPAVAIGPAIVNIIPASKGIAFILLVVFGQVIGGIAAGFLFKQLNKSQSKIEMPDVKKPELNKSQVVTKSLIGK